MTAVLLILLAVVFMAVGVMVGALIVDTHYSHRRAWLASREARLERLWRSLQAAHRINAGFWGAQEAMRREAREQYRPGDQLPPS
jgi:hypothetical protein